MTGIQFTNLNPNEQKEKYLVIQTHSVENLTQMISR